MSTFTLNINLIPNAMAQDYGDDYNYNNNHSDDIYSKYPIELNKYECQKGPFEGFFVSSVEFCKRATPIIDDDRGKDHSNVTIGPQGSPGPAGPQGLSLCNTSIHDR
jgi:hypothetical protein